ncbi:hypothetical protein BDN70DRAFT_725113 [Pholiota conissans]|uniref:Uncharacterized protein n=1 Tax=Pholiota conissans TaxID=109636 RepID=A0A9P5Z068_9AGAR|nr:hypothetical protein BDN70DRAFT_725113 [Pholiota conissans]
MRYDAMHALNPVRFTKITQMMLCSDGLHQHRPSVNHRKEEKILFQSPHAIQNAPFMKLDMKFAAIYIQSCRCITFWIIDLFPSAIYHLPSFDISLPINTLSFTSLSICSYDSSYHFVPLPIYAPFIHTSTCYINYQNIDVAAARCPLCSLPSCASHTSHALWTFHFIQPLGTVMQNFLEVIAYLQ